MDATCNDLNSALGRKLDLFIWTCVVTREKPLSSTVDEGARMNNSAGARACSSWALRMGLKREALAQHGLNTPPESVKRKPAKVRVPFNRGRTCFHDLKTCIVLDMHVVWMIARKKECCVYEVEGGEAFGSGDFLCSPQERPQEVVSSKLLHLVNLEKVVTVESSVSAIVPPLTVQQRVHSLFTPLKSDDRLLEVFIRPRL